MKLRACFIELRFITTINGASQSELRVVSDLQGVFVVLRFDDGQHRTKDFFLLNCRAGLNVGDNSGLNKETLFAVGTTAYQHSAAFTFSFFNVAIDRLESLLVDHSTHGRPRVSGVAKLDLRGLRNDLFEHRLVNLRVDYSARTGRALLTLKPKSRLDHTCRCLIQVRIIGNDDCIFAAHFGNYAFNPDLPFVDLRGPLVDPQPDLF